MILTTIFQILSIGEVWNPTDICKFDMPYNLKQKQINQALAFLNLQDISVT